MMNLDYLRALSSSIAKSAVKSRLSSCENALSLHSKYINLLKRCQSTLRTVLYQIFRGYFPQNDADAMKVLSNVYTLSTQKKKFHADAAFSGRSMIEMLGVLAIVGGLSIGAITGYQKAMLKYKLNKQTEQYNQLINAGLRYAGQWNFDIETHLVPYYKKLNLIPFEMISTASDSTLRDIFNNKISLIYMPRANWTSLFIYYALKNDDASVEICRNIFITAKAYHGQIFNLMSLSNSGTDEEKASAYYGDAECTGSRKCAKNLTLNQIDEMCRMQINQDDSHLKITWKG